MNNFRIPEQPIENSTLLNPTYVIKFELGSIKKQIRNLQKSVKRNFPDNYYPDVIHILCHQSYRKHIQREFDKELKENEDFDNSGILNVMRYVNELGSVDIIYV